ncbi:MAG: hypothetical protein IJZ25_05685, partial [Lachnospiraceae bacterium]|nr:hypothetical protein [Lachnospiraceae bacterium]
MKKIFFVMVLVMSMFLSACNYGERKIEKATEDTAVKVIVTPTTAPAPGTTGQVTTSLEVCGQEGIIILAASYYTAMEEGNTTSLMSLVSSPEL